MKFALYCYKRRFNCVTSDLLRQALLCQSITVYFETWAHSEDREITGTYQSGKYAANCSIVQCWSSKCHYINGQIALQFVVGITRPCCTPRSYNNGN